MKNKLILLDLDQTLIDLVDIHDQAFTKAFLEVFGIKTSFKKVESSGRTNYQIIQDLGQLEGINSKTIEAGIQKTIEKFDKYFPEFLTKVEVIFVLPGARELLQKINTQKLAVVTGSSSVATYPVLEKAKLDHFELIVTADDANTKKEMVAIVKNKLDPGNKLRIFLIGDGLEDMKAGKSINATTIGITTGFYNEKQLKEAGADHVFPNLKSQELLTILTGN